SFFFVWFLSLSLLPIFFNLNKKVRNSKIWSFTSFYFLLGIITIYFVFDKTFEFKYNSAYFLSIFTPYYFILSYYFIVWRKSLRQESI
ncbi:hypothetical protein B0A64_15720, partial [Flavobacterium araucananum]